MHGCWFNAFYTRVIPTHAIEMTSALLDHEVTGLLRAHRVTRATPEQKQDLAALIHLCGTGGGESFLERGFRTAGLRCGSEQPKATPDHSGGPGRSSWKMRLEWAEVCRS